MRVRREPRASRVPTIGQGDPTERNIVIPRIGICDKVRYGGCMDKEDRDDREKSVIGVLAAGDFS